MNICKIYSCTYIHTYIHTYIQKFRPYSLYKIIRTYGRPFFIILEMYTGRCSIFLLRLSCDIFSQKSYPHVLKKHLIFSIYYYAVEQLRPFFFVQILFSFFRSDFFQDTSFSYVRNVLRYLVGDYQKLYFSIFLSIIFEFRLNSGNVIEFQRKKYLRIIQKVKPNK